jgi:hypothetical protein
MPKKIIDTRIVGTRLPVEIDLRAQTVAKELSRRASGVPVTLSAVLHLAISRGLDAIEPELGLTSKSAKASKSAKSSAA